MKLGIDIGGTKIAVGLVNDEDKLIHKDSTPTLSERSSDEVIKSMAELAKRVVLDAGASINNIESIGVGCPGILDKEKGIVIYSNNIRWDYVELRKGLSQYFDKPIFLNNDANCAALGEYAAGAAKGYSSALTITLGTGVGGGYILNGKIHSGFNNAAGSFGHTVIVSGGALCTCGRKGCLEAYASVTGLIRMATEAAQADNNSKLADLICQGIALDGKNIFDCVKAGDKTATEVLDKYVCYLGEGVTNFINELQPEVIVIGGGISKDKEYLIEPLKTIAARDVFCKGVPLPDIVPACLGNDAGIIGAAFLKVYEGNY